MIDLAFWFMLPVAFVFSTLAMMTGIGGAVLFSPFFLLFLQLPAPIAFTVGLFIELFGFSSGLLAYWKRKLIHVGVVKQLTPFVFLGVVLGVFLKFIVAERLLVAFLVFLLLFISVLFFLKKATCSLKHHPVEIERESHPDINHIPYMIRFPVFIGSAFIGSIASGLGEINEYLFNERLGMPFALSSGTSVFLVAFGALLSSIPSLFILLSDPFFSVSFGRPILSLIVFAVPGSILGAQLGVILARKISLEGHEPIVGAFFLLLAGLVLSSLM